MTDIKYFILFTAFILFTFILRDLPYVNVLVVNRIWIFYLFIILGMALYAIKFKLNYVIYLTMIFFAIMFALTMLKLALFAEAIGIVIYFALWIVIIYRIIMYLREAR